MASVLAGYFGSLQALSAAREEELLSIREIGPQVARSVRAFFDNPRNQEVVARLQDAGVRLQGEKAAAPNPWPEKHWFSRVA